METYSSSGRDETDRAMTGFGALSDSLSEAAGYSSSKTSFNATPLLEHMVGTGRGNEIGRVSLSGRCNRLGCPFNLSKWKALVKISTPVILCSPSKLCSLAAFEVSGLPYGLMPFCPRLSA